MSSKAPNRRRKKNKELQAFLAQGLKISPIFGPLRFFGFNTDKVYGAQKKRRYGFREPQDSPTYSFDVVKTVIGVGKPIPVIYGKNKIGGQIVQAYVTGSATTNQEQLYMLLLLGWGVLNKIGNQSTDANSLGNNIQLLEINGNESTEYPTVNLSLRLGTNSSAELPNTSISTTVIASNTDLLQGVPVSVTPIPLNTKFVEIKIEFTGLLGVNSNGAFLLTVEFMYEVIRTDTLVVVDTGMITVQHENAAIFRINKRSNLLPGDITYTVKVTRLTQNNTTFPPGYLSDSELISVTTYGGNIFTYPNMALLEIAALATDQFNGSVPNINVIVEGKHVSIWNGFTLSTAYSTNPAWVALDILINKNYGLGRVFTTAKVDLDSFKLWADYCDVIMADGSKRWTFNAVFDESGQNAWEVFLNVCDIGHGIPVFSDGTISINIDQARTAVKLITMGNIVPNTFSITYKNMNEAADAVSITFPDEDNNFEQETIEYRISDPVNSTYLTKAVTRLGITNKKQATREAKYILLDEQNTRRFVSFVAGPSCIDLITGDRFELGHDVAGWGTVSGRLTKDSDVDNEVTLDREVTIVSGVTKILVQRLIAGIETLTERIFSTTSGTYPAGSTLEVSAGFDTPPNKYSEYSVGDPTTKPFIVDRITIGDDLSCAIEAHEYIEAIYDDTANTIQAIVYSQLPEPGQAPENVINLTAINRTIARPDGSLYGIIAVYWAYPEFDPNSGKPRTELVEVYFRENGEIYWQQAGVKAFPSANFIIVDGIIPGMQYDIAVTPVSHSGDKLTPDAVPFITVLFTGASNRPPKVLNFVATQNLTTGQVSFTWDLLDDESTISFYEIRRDGDGGWGLAQVIAQVLPGINVFNNSDSWALPGISDIKPEQYSIRARNIAGLYSAEANYSLPVMVVPSNYSPNTLLVSFDTGSGALFSAGTLTNFTNLGADGLQITNPANQARWTSQNFAYVPVNTTVDARTWISGLQIFNVLNGSWEDLNFSWNSETGIGTCWEGDYDNPIITFLVEIKFDAPFGTFVAGRQRVAIPAAAIVSAQWRLTFNILSAFQTTYLLRLKRVYLQLLNYS